MNGLPHAQSKQLLASLLFHICVGFRASERGELSNILTVLYCLVKWQIARLRRHFLRSRYVLHCKKNPAKFATDVSHLQNSRVSKTFLSPVVTFTISMQLPSAVLRVFFTISYFNKQHFLHCKSKWWKAVMPWNPLMPKNASEIEWYARNTSSVTFRTWRKKQSHPDLCHTLAFIFISVFLPRNLSTNKIDTAIKEHWNCESNQIHSG